MLKPQADYGGLRKLWIKSSYKKKKKGWDKWRFKMAEQGDP